MTVDLVFSESLLQFYKKLYRWMYVGEILYYTLCQTDAADFKDYLRMCWLDFYNISPLLNKFRWLVLPFLYILHNVVYTLYHTSQF